MVIRGGFIMTVQLVTNEKIAETSSKGNQEKWFDGASGRWYKLDQFGYESLSEVIVSRPGCVIRIVGILRLGLFGSIERRVG